MVINTHLNMNNSSHWHCSHPIYYLSSISILLNNRWWRRRLTVSMQYICRSKSASYDNPWQYQTILELLSHLVLDIIKSISRTTGHYFIFLLICIHINHLDIEYWQAVMENKTRTRYESALTVKHISCLTSCTGCWYPFSGKKYLKKCHQKALREWFN